jgi:hypothetical protein
MTLDKIIERAKRMKRIGPTGLVLCDNCDTPASESLSLELGWTACAPCVTGEAKSFDAGDLIPTKSMADVLGIHKALGKALKSVRKGKRK